MPAATQSTRWKRLVVTAAAALALALVVCGLTQVAHRELEDRELADLDARARAIAASPDLQPVLWSATGPVADLQRQRLGGQLRAMCAATPACRSLSVWRLAPDAQGRSPRLWAASDPAQMANLPAPVAQQPGDGLDARLAKVTQEGNLHVTVPLGHDASSLSEVPSRAQAEALVGDAVALLQSAGRQALVAEIMNPIGRLRVGELYVAAFDRRMTVLAHPLVPDQTGHNWANEQDLADGVHDYQLIQDVAEHSTTGWLHLWRRNLVRDRLEWQDLYVHRQGDVVLVCGVPSHRGPEAVLQLTGPSEVPWQPWLQGPLGVAGCVTGLAGCAAAIALASTRPWWARRRKFGRLSPGYLALVGLAFTAGGTWLASAHVDAAQREAFAQHAAGSLHSVGTRLAALQTRELRGLARRLAEPGTISKAEFAQRVAQVLDPAVFAWEWLPRLSGEQIAAFEAQERQHGWPTFAVWQRGPGGVRESAKGRGDFYPVARVEPLANNEAAVGFDLGSEPRRRATIDDAVATGLPTATPPLTLVQERAHQRTILALYPVTEPVPPHALRGLALAAVRLNDLLSALRADDSLFVTLSAQAGGGDSWVEAARSGTEAVPPYPTLAYEMPIAAFGQVLLVRARPGPGWHAGAGQVLVPSVALGGLLLTALLSAFGAMAVRQRRALELQVDERTAELAATAESYREQFAANSSVMLLLDPSDGRIVDANAAAVAFYGFTHSELCARKISAINTQPPERTAQALREVTTHHSGHFEFEHRLADGSVRIVEVSASRILRGEKVLIHAIVHDISERKRMELRHREVEQRLESALAATQDGVWDWDIQNDVVHHNLRWCDIIGLDEAHLSHPMALFAEHLYPDDRPAVMAAIAAALEGDRPYISEHRMVQANGDCVWVMDRGRVTLRDAAGRPLRMVGAIADISARRAAEETQRASNAELARAIERADAANAAKGEFLANMSHELRTPMNGVIGVLELLALAPLEPKQRQLVEAARTSGELLLTLVDDILDLSKIEAGKLQLESVAVDLTDLLRRDLDMVAKRAEGKGIAVAVHLPDDPCWVLTDPSRLHQVILNLLSNAVKFTDRGRVDLTLSVGPALAGKVAVQIAVADTGVGIPQDRIEQIFSPFTQADASTTRRYGGTGLGLTIVRRIVRLMGGEVHVRSVPGKGSTFVLAVDLLTCTPASAATPPATMAARDMAALKVLLVEDNRINELVVVQMLALLGTQPSVARDGQEALRLLAEHTFDVVLMDCQLPVQDGYEATRRLRNGDAGPRNQNVPVIALTANAMQRDRERSLEAGMNDHLSKPLRFHELRAAVARAAAGQTVAAQPAAEPTPIASPALAAGPDISAFDADDLLQRTGFNPQLAQRILFVFLNDARVHLHRLTDLSSVDPRHSELPAVLHALKGASANAGALELAQLAGRDELALKSEAGSGLTQDDLHEYLRAFRRLQQAIAAAGYTLP